MKVDKKTIVLNFEVHKKVEETKERFSFKTYNDLIKSMCYFFENNKVSPSQTLEENSTEIFRSDIRMYFDDLRKIQKDDSQSLRKFLGALEKNYLKPIKNSFIKEEVLEALKSDREEEKTIPKIDELVQTDTHKNTSELDRLKRQVSDYKEARDEALRNAENYKNLLKELTSSIAIIQGVLKKEICQFSMTADQYRDFKNRAGV